MGILPKKNIIVINENQYMDFETLKYTLVTSPGFIKKWAQFAHHLGIAACHGIHSKNIGENFIVTRSGDNYNIDAVSFRRTRGSSGISTRLKMTISNIRLEFIPESISTLGSEVIRLPGRIVSSTFAVNRNPNEKSDVTKFLKYTKSSSTSTHSSHNIGNSIAVKYKHETQLLGVSNQVEVAYVFSHHYTFGQQQEQIESDSVTDSITVPVPPSSKVRVKVILFKNQIKIPYKALASIKYDVHLSGILENKHAYMNPWYYMYKFRTHFKFGNTELSALEDIYTQFMRRNIPGTSEWDWNAILSHSDLNNLFDVLFSEEQVQLNAEFFKIDATNFVIESGAPIPLRNSDLTTRII